MPATEDLDGPYDARRRLIMSGDVKERGLVGALRSVDGSFARAADRTCTATNKGGYMVDLVEPQDHDRIMRQGQARPSDHPDDLIATTTDGSRWLLDVPKFTATAFDERGLPLRVVTLDLRAYALQKRWIVENDPTRDPAKRARDERQARLVANIAVKYLGLQFDDPALSGLPRSFRRLSDKLVDGDEAGPMEW